MLVDAIIATTGAAVLIPLTFSGLIAARGRQSEELLVAPRGAGFGDATRLTRAAAHAAREQNTATERVPLTVVRTEAPLNRSDRRAA